jgi:hypothetical protein
VLVSLLNALAAHPWSGWFRPRLAGQGRAKASVPNKSNYSNQIQIESNQIKSN